MMMFWAWFKDDFRTCGDNRNGDSLLSYQVCIPNLIFSSSFSNCVGTLLMIKIHDPGHPLMHELIEKS